VNSNEDGGKKMEGERAQQNGSDSQKAIHFLSRTKTQHKAAKDEVKTFAQRESATLPSGKLRITWHEM
jgi:hypothetical protein